MAEPTKQRRGLWILVCGALLFLTVVYLFVGDKTVWGAWVSIAPPVLVAVVFIPSAVRLRSWTVAALIGAFLLLTSEWPRFGRESEISPETLRLVSWNIGSGNTRWADAVEPLDPDFVLVQEGSRPIRMWDGFVWKGTPDPGVLSRFPLDVLPTDKVGPWTEPQLLLAEIRGKKLLLVNVRLMLPSAVIQLVNPFEERPLENYRARILQYEKLETLVSATAVSVGADAVVVAGDFNVPARMPSLAPLRKVFRDAWDVAGTGWGGTAPEFFPFARIDHVWISETIEAVSVRVERLAGSDHRAVIVDFDLE